MTVGAQYDLISIGQTCDTSHDTTPIELGVYDTVQLCANACKINSRCRFFTYSSEGTCRYIRNVDQSREDGYCKRWITTDANFYTMGSVYPDANLQATASVGGQQNGSADWPLCGPTGYEYLMMKGCPSSHAYISSQKECEFAAQALGLDDIDASLPSSGAIYGCYTSRSSKALQFADSGESIAIGVDSSSDTRSICKCKASTEFTLNVGMALTWTSDESGSRKGWEVCSTLTEASPTVHAKAWSTTNDRADGEAECPVVDNCVQTPPASRSTPTIEAWAGHVDACERVRCSIGSGPCRKLAGGNDYVWDSKQEKYINTALSCSSRCSAGAGPCRRKVGEGDFIFCEEANRNGSCSSTELKLCLPSRSMSDRYSSLNGMGNQHIVCSEAEEGGKCPADMVLCGENMLGRGYDLLPQLDLAIGSHNTNCTALDCVSRQPWGHLCIKPKFDKMGTPYCPVVAPGPVYTVLDHGGCCADEAPEYEGLSSAEECKTALAKLDFSKCSLEFLSVRKVPDIGLPIGCSVGPPLGTNRRLLFQPGGGCHNNISDYRTVCRRVMIEDASVPATYPTASNSSISLMKTGQKCKGYTETSSIIDLGTASTLNECAELRKAHSKSRWSDGSLFFLYGDFDGKVGARKCYTDEVDTIGREGRERCDCNPPLANEPFCKQWNSYWRDWGVLDFYRYRPATDLPAFCGPHSCTFGSGPCRIKAIDSSVVVCTNINKNGTCDGDSTMCYTTPTASVQTMGPEALFWDAVDAATTPLTTAEATIECTSTTFTTTATSTMSSSITSSLTSTSTSTLTSTETSTLTTTQSATGTTTLSTTATSTSSQTTSATSTTSATTSATTSLTTSSTTSPSSSATTTPTPIPCPAPINAGLDFSAKCSDIYLDDEFNKDRMKAHRYTQLFQMCNSLCARALFCLPDADTITVNGKPYRKLCAESCLPYIDVCVSLQSNRSVIRTTTALTTELTEGLHKSTDDADESFIITVVAASSGAIVVVVGLFIWRKNNRKRRRQPPASYGGSTFINPSFSDNQKESDNVPSTDVFLTHDWGIDELGRNNHKRVVEINELLKAAGFSTWCDSDRMTGDIVGKMIDGIDHTKVVLCFVTKRYVDKVNTPENITDNCKKEFMYAARKHTASQILPVVMEPRMLETSLWVGPVAFELGGTLYTDLTNEKNIPITSESTEFVQLCAEISQRLRRTAYANGNRQANVKSCSDTPELAALAPMQPLCTNTWRELDFEQMFVDVNKLLGQGNYGKVYLCTIDTDDGQDAGKVYAAKVLPDANEMQNVSKTHAHADMLAEIHFMQKLQANSCNPHVIKMEAFVRTPSPVLILEYASGGSLEALLISRRADQGLDLVQILSFATTIADGMRFLAERAVVHRDLASRNVLLTESLQCKISDFGLARTVSVSNGMYTANTSHYHPSNPTAYKWTSLEGLRDDIYTTQGDVWSYGVLIYEVCSLAERPYPGMGTPEEVKHFLISGNRLSPAADWDHQLIDIMQMCWNEVPSVRPTFDELAQSTQQRLEQLTQSSEANLSSAELESVRRGYTSPGCINTTPRSPDVNSDALNRSSSEPTDYLEVSGADKGETAYICLDSAHTDSEYSISGESDVDC